MNPISKLQYLFSSTHLRRMRQVLKAKLHGMARKRIRLAVVGTTSSGKSFLLRDILKTLTSMSGVFYPLDTELQSYKNFANYSPDETGGHGGTPLYACRPNNHYGAHVVHKNESGDKYDLSFLNIPGEIFAKPLQNRSSRLQAYLILKDQISQLRSPFVVTTWHTDAGDIRYIVETAKASTATDEDRASTAVTNEKNLKLRYMQWNEIFAELTSGGYVRCAGSERRISGKKLLKNFFEYDTDSVIRSIRDLIEKNQLKGIDFDSTDFEALGYDRSFTFLHYCSQATDIVMCDRIFIKKETKTANDEMLFGDLAEGLDSFLEESDNRHQVNVYLAFRNVDFLLLQKEQTFKQLYNELQAGMNDEQRRNAIYSLFNYSLLHYLDSSLVIPDEEFNDWIGLPEGKRSELIQSDVEKLKSALIDFDGSDGQIYMGSDLRQHINSRLGSQGQSFRRILLKTGYIASSGSTARDKIVPHVYYTCTPITEDFDIYENYIIGNDLAPDFRRVADGKTRLFYEQFSHACFGSYQLCMDLLTQHKLGDFNMGSLLTILEDQA